MGCLELRQKGVVRSDIGALGSDGDVKRCRWRHFSGRRPSLRVGPARGSQTRRSRRQRRRSHPSSPKNPSLERPFLGRSPSSTLSGCPPQKSRTASFRRAGLVPENCPNEHDQGGTLSVNWVLRTRIWTLIGPEPPRPRKSVISVDSFIPEAGNISEC